MSNVTTMKRPDQAAEERQDPLRAAIAAEREARTAVASAEQALQRGRGVLGSAQDEAETARKLVDKAKDRDSRATAAAVRNRSSASPDASATRSARLRVQMCEDSVEVAAAAVARIQEELDAARDAARWATNNVLVLRNNLLAEFAGQLLERARARRLEVKVCEAALSELLNNSDVGAPEFEDAGAESRARAARTAELGAMRKQAADFFTTRRTELESEAESAAVSEIRAFAARLSADPNATPPSL